MKLIGGKDYYDGVTGFDTDDRIRFVRQNYDKSEARPKDKIFTFRSPYKILAAKRKSLSWRPELADLRTIEIIFCGRMYMGFLRSEVHVHEDTKLPSVTYKSFWNGASLLAELDRQECELRTRDSYLFDPSKSVKFLTNETIDEYFEPKDLPQRDIEMLIEEQVVHSICATTNTIGYVRYSDSYPAWHDNTDGLKRFGFASVVDPWQAYQQIDMWLGSQLARDEDNMVRLDDKELIQKHGFDKTSFRNTHHQGKPRRHT